LLECELPALPVLDGSGRFAGIFGEREFITALFPGYLGELRSAGFVSRTLEHSLGKRSACRGDPVGHHRNTEHVEVAADFSDAQVAWRAGCSTPDRARRSRLYARRGDGEATNVSD